LRLKKEILSELNFLAEGISLSERLYLGFVSLGSASYVISAMINLILGLSLLSIFCPILCSSIMILSYIFLYRRDKVDLAFLICIICNNYIFTPVMWISNSGLNGGFQYFIFAFAAATIIIIPGKKSILHIIGYSLSILLLSLIDYFNPSLIAEYSVAESQITDMIISLPFAIIVFSIIILILKRVYDFEHKKLSEISTKDELTNIYNRRYIMNFLEEIIKKPEIYDIDNKFIVFIDVDDFKKVNDTFGHKKGDELLINICITIKRNIRKNDYLSRIGGDEFLLIINSENIHAAKNTVDRIIKNIESENKISVSAGITKLDSENGDITKILAKADRLMYESKKSGKNKFSFS